MCAFEVANHNLDCDLTFDTCQTNCRLPNCSVFDRICAPRRFLEVANFDFSIRIPIQQLTAVKITVNFQIVFYMIDNVQFIKVSEDSEFDSAITIVIC